jgi:hypothetical protein
MATYTFDVIARCSGGAHVRIGINKDGERAKVISMNYSDLTELEVNVEEALVFFFRQAVKASGATTLLQAKAAIESLEIVL